MNSIVMDLGKEDRPAAGTAPGGPVAGAADPRIPRIAIHFYCQSPDMIGEIDVALVDRRMSRAQTVRRTGGIAAATRRYADEPTPDLLVLEAAVPDEQLLAEIDALAAVCDPRTKVILIGRSNDIDLYRGLIGRGVSEYLRAPVASARIISEIATLFSEPSSVRTGRTYAFLSARGGTGSSTIAHNVAWLLGRLSGGDVVLADLDLACGTAALDFDIAADRGIAEALRERDALDDQMLERLLIPCGERLHLLAAPATLESDLQPEAVDHVIDAARKRAPHVVLDLPHLASEWTQNALLAADEVVITATPDLTSLRNTGKLLDLLRRKRRHDSAPLLVLNQVGMPKRPEIKPARFAAAIGLQPVASIRFDPRCFGTASNTGKVLTSSPGGRRHATPLRQVAQALAGRPLKTSWLPSFRLFGARKAK